MSIRMIVLDIYEADDFGAADKVERESMIGAKTKQTL